MASERSHSKEEEVPDHFASASSAVRKVIDDLGVDPAISDESFFVELDYVSLLTGTLSDCLGAERSRRVQQLRGELAELASALPGDVTDANRGALERARALLHAVPTEFGEPYPAQLVAESDYPVVASESLGSSSSMPGSAFWGFGALVLAAVLGGQMWTRAHQAEPLQTAAIEGGSNAAQPLLVASNGATCGPLDKSPTSVSEEPAPIVKSPVQVARLDRRKGRGSSLRWYATASAAPVKADWRPAEASSFQEEPGGLIPLIGNWIMAGRDPIPR